MPRVSDASDVTRFHRVNATVNPDPTIKSRTFVAPLKQGFLSSEMRASEVSRINPNTVLSTPPWKSPGFKGRIFLS
jgi:hypothetical protein